MLVTTILLRITHVEIRVYVQRKGIHDSFSRPIISHVHKSESSIVPYRKGFSNMVQYVDGRSYRSIMKYNSLNSKTVKVHTLYRRGRPTLNAKQLIKKKRIRITGKAQRKLHKGTG